MTDTASLDRMHRRCLSRAVVHAVTWASAPLTSMQHQVFLLDHGDKVDIAAEVATRPQRTLFFLRSKHGADGLAKQLVRRGINAAAIHGNLNQNQRRRALDGFAAGRVRGLVATDVAARGLHIDALDLVVHFDPRRRTTSATSIARDVPRAPAQPAPSSRSWKHIGPEMSPASTPPRYSRIR